MKTPPARLGPRRVAAGATSRDGPRGRTIDGVRNPDHIAVLLLAAALQPRLGTRPRAYGHHPGIVSAKLRWTGFTPFLVGHVQTLGSSERHLAEWELVIIRSRLWGY